MSTTRSEDARPRPGGTEPTGPEHPEGWDEAPHGRAALWAFVRLGVVVGAVAAGFILLGWGPVLVFIVLVVAIVMLHELGHFATAKWSGMKVTEYFVGFGPRLWSVRRGETEYGVKAIPAGGYVKIPGMSNLEQIDPADEARTYRQKPYSKRVMVASAGSVMHMLIALVLAWVAVLAFGVPQDRVSVGALTAFPKGVTSPAEKAGLAKGDVIVAVDGHENPTSEEFHSIVSRSAGKPVTITYRHDGHLRTATVTPVDGHTVVVNGTPLVSSATNAGIVGIEEDAVMTPEGPLRAVGTAGIDVGRATAATVAGFVHFFSPAGLSNFFSQVANSSKATQAAKNPASSGRVYSLIGAGRAAVEAQHAGYLYLIELLIALNIAFALLNMLPMLPLDGGHVAIALYERARTRRGQPYYRADATKLLPVAYAFMAFLMVIAVSAMYLDLAHPVANPFSP